MRAPTRLSSAASDRRSREELVERLADAHLQLAERDAEIRRLVERDGEIAALRGEVERLREDLHHVSMQLEAIRETRAWRTVTLYWRVRARLLGE